MAITKRPDGRWHVNIQPGGRTGHQVKRVFQTQREAKEFETWARAQHHQDPDWSPSKRDDRRLKVLLKIWYDSHGQGLAAGANTFARLNALADKMSDPPPNLVRARFDEYRQARIDEGKALNTINREHAYLRAVFNELRRLGHWSGDNPLQDVRQFKIQERELTFLRAPEIKQLLDALAQSSNPHALLTTRVALATGGRWGECEALTKRQLHGHLIQFAQTKSKKTRGVPISRELSSDLEAHMRSHPTGSDRLFDSAYGAFLAALDRANIKLPNGQASHVLRHTFASHFMANGGNILTLQRVLGHATLTMTMRYAHLAPDHMQEVLALNPLAENGGRKSVGSLKKSAQAKSS